MSNIIIYGLYESSSEEIRYIGKTNKKDLQKRLNQHISESYKKKETTHKRNWIKSVINNGGKINIKCIEIVDEKCWKEKECFWISSFSNLTNTTKGGECGREIFYTISYDECKKYIQENLNIKSKSEWYKNINIISEHIPKNPRESYLKRGWISWGDFFGTQKIQDNIISKKYISYEESKEWIKNNIEAYTILDWKENVKNNKIPEFIPNRPERFYKSRGWINWGNFLSTGRIANQNKKEIFLPYIDSCNFVKENNIISMKQFRELKLPENIPTNPQRYYKEWKNWGEFFGTKKIQDNIISKNYLCYIESKEWIKTNLSNIKSEKIWKHYVKNSQIPVFIPNHPELFFNRKNRGWLGWKDFLNKNLPV